MKGREAVGRELTSREAGGATTIKSTSGKKESQNASIRVPGHRRVGAAPAPAEISRTRGAHLGAIWGEERGGTEKNTASPHGSKRAAIDSGQARGGAPGQTREASGAARGREGAVERKNGQSRSRSRGRPGASTFRAGSGVIRNGRPGSRE